MDYEMNQKQSQIITWITFSFAVFIGIYGVINLAFNY